MPHVTAWLVLAEGGRLLAAGGWRERVIERAVQAVGDDEALAESLELWWADEHGEIHRADGSGAGA